MSLPPNKGVPPAKPRFPWLLLLAFLLTVFLFWILPAWMGPRNVKLEYSGAAAK